MSVIQLSNFRLWPPQIATVRVNPLQDLFARLDEFCGLLGIGKDETQGVLCESR
jgi:hypothetical protein